MNKLRKGSSHKSWWWNMNNIIVNYLHKSEEYDMYTIHMNDRCSLDRTCPCPKVWSGFK